MSNMRAKHGGIVNLLPNLGWGHALGVRKQLHRHQLLCEITCWEIRHVVSTNIHAGTFFVLIEYTVEIWGGISPMDAVNLKFTNTSGSQIPDVGAIYRMNTFFWRLKIGVAEGSRKLILTPYSCNTVKNITVRKLNQCILKDKCNTFGFVV